VSAPQPPAERHGHVCDPLEVECLDPAHGPVYAPGCEPVDHAGAAADHIHALIVAAEPTFRVTAEQHDAMVELVNSVARLLAGGAR
jgi:hypothetical protein